MFDTNYVEIFSSNPVRTAPGSWTGRTARCRHSWKLPRQGNAHAFCAMIDTTVICGAQQDLFAPAEAGRRRLEHRQQPHRRIFNDAAVSPPAETCSPIWIQS